MQEANSDQRRAAEYVRMSTDHQKYSVDNQRDAIATYAALRDISIVKSFSDAGKSGVTLNGRDALRSLLAEVIGGKNKFEMLLVYDVSRWGRFQDADEAAHYEFLCRSNGVQVVYCAEPFENDGTPLSSIYKGIKRAMAGEYSRELSRKISIGKKRIVSKGYFQGGPAGYGLRRMVIDESGTPRGILQAGERKNVQSDRVILVPGPAEEVATVLRIYDLFIDQALGAAEIAKLLNEETATDPDARRWNHYAVREVLSNEKYIGNLVFNRSEARLGRRVRQLPVEGWTRVDGAFEAVVPPARFAQARAIFAQYHISDEEVLSRLRRAYAREGRLTQAIIKADPTLPAVSNIGERFGSLYSAYKLVGYEPPLGHKFALATRLQRREAKLGLTSPIEAPGPGGHLPRAQKDVRARLSRAQATLREIYVSNEQLLDGLRRLYATHGYLTSSIIDADPLTPIARTYRTRFGSLFTAYRLVGYEPPAERLCGAARDLQAVERAKTDNGLALPVEPSPVELVAHEAAVEDVQDIRPGYRPESSERMIELLGILYEREGRLTGVLIDDEPDMPCARAYFERFGSMLAAYALVGFVPPTRYLKAIEGQRITRDLRRPPANGRTSRNLP